MAMLGSGAPVDLLLSSRSLLAKIQNAIPFTHSACVQSESLKLNSSENSKYEKMASIIGIPAAPVLKALSPNVTLETSLALVSKGLQLYEDLLGIIVNHLEQKKELSDLKAHISDLKKLITRMLKVAGGQAEDLPKPTLNLPGDYEVQVAAHLTLLQLQSFGQDVGRCLESLDQSR
ncbi:unnamed protein product [Tetraodon nigroviridis]|uniref:(spotted green pufferfish) hypothetical protein n=1 Tax=Tetraodon nigroviridis TaxID=99883 RepID=Q4S4N8_TETNG|nr:unnamed protein product [Tetraodon nigroviridis]